MLGVFNGLELKNKLVLPYTQFRKHCLGAQSNGKARHQNRDVFKRELKNYATLLLNYHN